MGEQEREFEFGDVAEVTIPAIDSVYQPWNGKRVVVIDSQDGYSEILEADGNHVDIRNAYLTLVSRPSQGQRLEEVELADVNEGGHYFVEYVKTNGRPLYVEDDEGRIKRYRLVDAELQVPSVATASVAQAASIIKTVIGVELECREIQTERLRDLRDALTVYEEED